MAIRFVTDSASDITLAEAKELGVRLVPLTVSFGSEEYADGLELSHRGFFEKLIESDVMPTTSQVSPAAFSEVFAELTANGDELVVITLSSKLSGTYQSACIAAEDFPGRVHVVDSLSATMGERLLVLEGLRLVSGGMSAAETAKTLEAYRSQICVLGMLDTMEYLKKGGRISSATAFAGELLAIKPVVTIDDGEVRLIGKARGSKNGNNLLRKLVGEKGGVDFSRPFTLAYSGLSDAMLKKYIDDSRDLWQSAADALPISTIGCVIGAHLGPGAVGVAFFAKG